MEILRFQTPYLQSNTYLIAESGHGLLIDPCEMKEVKDAIATRGLTVDYAILTHEHWDHITGVDWARGLGAKVVCSHASAQHIKSPKDNGSRYIEQFCAVQANLRCAHDPGPFACHADMELAENDKLAWHGHLIAITSTPGHSTGSICILMDRNTLFCGDVLFQDMPTNTRLKGGDSRALTETTLPYLKTLPAEIIAYPGHGTPFLLDERLECTVNRTKDSVEEDEVDHRYS